MGVIVDNGHAACLAHQIETTTDALEIRKRRSGGGGIFAKRPQDRNHACGIERVMDARVALQFDIDHSAIGEREREQRAHAMRARSSKCACRSPHRSHRQPCDGRSSWRALRAWGRSPHTTTAPSSGTDCMTRAETSCANLLDAARVVIQMVGFDIGDERDIGRQVQERAVALIGLDNVIFALA